MLEIALSIAVLLYCDCVLIARQKHNTKYKMPQSWKHGFSEADTQMVPPTLKEKTELMENGRQTQKT